MVEGDRVLAAAWPHLALQSPLLLLFVPVAVFLAIWGYRSTTPPLSARDRVPFIVLRSAAFTVLLFMLTVPLWHREEREALPPRIVALVDASASMSAVDEAGAATTRFAAAQRALADLAAAMPEDVAFEVASFGMQVSPAVDVRRFTAAPPAPEAPGTDLVGALREIGDRYAGQNLQGVVLLSDGRPTRGDVDPEALAGLAHPVFVLAFGDTVQPHDLVIDRCEYAPVAYAHSRTTLAARIDNSGFRGKQSMLRLIDDRGREIFRKTLRFEADHGRQQVEIPVEIDTPGRRTLHLELEPLDGEVTTRNNRREIRIEVLKNRLRVLVVAARPTWDVRFLVRYLAGDPNVEPVAVHLRHDGTWVDASGEPFALPTERTALLAYDLFVIGAPGSTRDAAFYQALPEAIERGRGLWVLGGRESVYTVPGIYEALAGVLPVQRARARTPRYRVARVRLTAQGRLHPASSMWNETADAQRVLAGIPPLLGVHAEQRPKPGALPLMVTAEAGALPVLVVARYGQGHTAAFTGFPVWRWGFSDQETPARIQREFVGHLVRWLTQPRDVKRVRLAASKPVYEGGEGVDFVGQVLDEQFEPIADATLRVEVHRVDAPDSTVATLLLERRAGHAGEFRGRLAGLAPGEYDALAVAERAATTVGQDTTRFTVESYSVEFANTAQDVDFLREIAARTGGRYALGAAAAEVAAELPHAPRPVILRSEIEVWDRMPLFVLFVGLLATEWLLRKRRGLL